MSEIRFAKMDGAGNDFILIDNRDGGIERLGPSQVANLCHRRRSIGADGVIMIEPALEGTDFRMRYYNADGLEVEMCGNGARCVARFAADLGVGGRTLKFETGAGVVEALVTGESVSLNMEDAIDLSRSIPWESESAEYRVHFVRSGVPHVVLFLDENERLGATSARDLADTTLRSLGRAIRYDDFWKPEGVNANFASVEGSSSLVYQTYERGVEEVTLACGTGAVAVGVVAAHLDKVRPPLELETRGGDILGVDFRLTDFGATEVNLRGPARVNYRGVIDSGSLGI